MSITKNFFLLIVFTLTAQFISAQYISTVTTPDKNTPLVTDPKMDLSVKYASFIDTVSMKKTLTTLASDEYEGRETGEAGSEKAASFLAANLAKAGIMPKGVDGTYFQPVAFTFHSWDDTDIFINGIRYRHLWDYLSFPAENSSVPLRVDKEVYFAGYGIEDSNYSDYKGKNVKGKIIMINKGEPMKNDSVSWITGTTQHSEWSTDIMKKLKLAKEKGAALVLIIEDEITKKLGENRKYLLGPSVQLGDQSKTVLQNANYCYISSTMAKAIIGQKEEKIIEARKKIREKGKFKIVPLDCDIKVNQTKKQRMVIGKNVAGFIEGKTKPEEVIVVSAHFDHLGKRGDQIFHGADDNGSGSTTILEIAKAFQQAANDLNQPDRSILFLWVTGEEKGLYGSDFYTSMPLIPLSQTIADVNVDMVGRVDKKYEQNHDYIYVIGSDRLSSELHQVNEEANAKYTGLVLDYTYNAESDPNRYYYRSDHYNFAKNGIPSIFFFNGTHEDYHQPTDTVDKINFKKMAKVGQHIFHTIWELASRPTAIKVDKKG